MPVFQNIDRILSHYLFFPVAWAVILLTLYIGYAPTSIGLGILGACTLWSRLRIGGPMNLNQKLLLPVLIFLLVVVSYAWSIDQALSAKGIGRMANFIIIPCMFLLQPRFNKNSLKIVLKWFTYTNLFFGLIFLLIASIRFIEQQSAEVFFYHELVLALELNAIYVSVYFLSSYFYLIQLKGRSWLEKAAIPFFAGMIVLLSSKMAIIIMILGTVIYLFAYKGWTYLKNWKAVLLIAVTVIIGVLFSNQLVSRIVEEKRTNIEEVFNKTEFGKIYPWTGTTIRLFHLRLLAEQIEEDNILFTGYGIFASRVDLRERHKKYDTYKGFHTYNYHNQYAQMIAELGIFGLLLLLFSLVILCRQGIFMKEFFVLSFSLMMFLVFLSESFLWGQKGLVFFMIFYGMISGLEKQSKKTADEGRILLKS